MPAADAVLINAQVSTYRVATVRVVDAPLAGDDREKDERLAKRRIRRLNSKVWGGCLSVPPAPSAPPQDLSTLIAHLLEDRWAPARYQCFHLGHALSGHDHSHCLLTLSLYQTQRKTDTPNGGDAVGAAEGASVVNNASADAAAAAAAAPSPTAAVGEEAGQRGLGRSDSTSSSSGGEPEVSVMVIC